MALLAACDAAAPSSPLRLLEGGEVARAEVGFVDGPFATPPGVDPRSRWIQWPESVTAGIPFTVTVRTAGSRCRDTAHTELSYSGGDQTALVVPYDVAQQPAPVAANDTSATDYHCPDDLRMLERRVTLRFDSPGIATIVLRGRYFYQGQPAEHRVTVSVR